MNAKPSLPAIATRGRPSKENALRLRKRIRLAALKQFRTQGYAGSSIDGIARAARVSRTTIYSLYSDKPTLFHEIISTAVIGTALEAKVDYDDRPPLSLIRETMQAINRSYHRDPNLEMLRLCIAEAERFPNLFENIEDSMSSTLNDLVDYFNRMQAEKRMISCNSVQAALLLNVMSLGSLTPFLVNPLKLGPDLIDGHLELAITIFVGGCFGPDALAG